MRAPPAHVKYRYYPKQVTQEDDVERYGGLKFKIDENIFAACDKLEMRNANIPVIASSDFVNISKYLFWPVVVMLAGTDLMIGCNPYQWQLVFNDQLKWIRYRLFLPASRISRASNGRSRVVARNQRRSGFHGRDHGCVKRRRVREDDSEASVCVIRGVCTPPGRSEIWVCHDSPPLRREIRCDHTCLKSQSEGEEPETSLVRIACSMVRYIKCHEGIERSFITAACVRRTVGSGTVQF